MSGKTNLEKQQMRGCLGLGMRVVGACEWEWGGCLCSMMEMF